MQCNRRRQALQTDRVHPHGYRHNAIIHVIRLRSRSWGVCGKGAVKAAWDGGRVENVSQSSCEASCPRCGCSPQPGAHVRTGEKNNTHHSEPGGAPRRPRAPRTSGRAVARQDYRLRGNRRAARGRPLARQRAAAPPPHLPGYALPWKRSVAVAAGAPIGAREGGSPAPASRGPGAAPGGARRSPAGAVAAAARPRWGAGPRSGPIGAPCPEPAPPPGTTGAHRPTRGPGLGRSGPPAPRGVVASPGLPGATACLPRATGSCRKIEL